MIDERFIYVGAVLTLSGAYTYIRDTLRGQTAPNRVTWTLWGVEPLLAFGVQRQAHVGLASLWTLVLGIVPFIVLAASFKDPQSVWKLGKFDVVCGSLSVFGLVVWIATDQPTVALVSFVVADNLAALPTLRKAWLEPGTESSWNFLAGAISAGIALLVLPDWTTAGALFPLCVMIMNSAIWLCVRSRLGPRWRGEPLTSEAIA